MSLRIRNKSLAVSCTYHQWNPAESPTHPLILTSAAQVIERDAGTCHWHISGDVTVSTFLKENTRRKKKFKLHSTLTTTKGIRCWNGRSQQWHERSAWHPSRSHRQLTLHSILPKQKRLLESGELRRHKLYSKTFFQSNGFLLDN